MPGVEVADAAEERGEIVIHPRDRRSVGHLLPAGCLGLADAEIEKLWGTGSDVRPFLVLIAPPWLRLFRFQEQLSGPALGTQALGEFGVVGRWVRTFLLGRPLPVPHQ